MFADTLNMNIHVKLNLGFVVVHSIFLLLLDDTLSKHVGIAFFHYTNRCGRTDLSATPG